MAGNPLQGAFDAKIGKVPVVLVGIPVVIVAGLVLRHLGSKNATGSGDAATAADSANPAFFAKDVPDTWAAIDPGTGYGHSPDGTITYIPSTGNDPVDGGHGSATGDTPGDGTSDPTKPVTPPVPVTPKPAPKPVPKPPAKKPPVTPKAPPPRKATPNHALDVSHKIKPGETLTSIAKANHTTVAAITKINPGIKNPNVIYAGSSIKVPVKKK